MRKLKTVLFVAALLFSGNVMYAHTSEAVEYGVFVEPTTQKYDVKDFNSIQASGSLKITYEQSPEYSVEARSSKDMLDVLTVENQAGVLRLGLTKSLRRLTSDIEIIVKGPALDYLKLSGACEFMGNSVTMNTNATIDLSGACSVYFVNFKCKELNAELSGACNIDGTFVVNGEAKLSNSGAGSLKGNINATDMVRLSNSGASSLKMDVKSPRIIVRNSGTSGTTLAVDCDHLEVENSGISRMTLSGRADKVDTKNSGMSKINYVNFNKN